MAPLHLVTIFFMLSVNFASAQLPPINFYKITNEDGLSQATVNVLFKDSEGFLWVGTDDGLNRFNGKQFKKYFYRYYDTTSIAANEIFAICEDKLGKMWFAHYNAGISSLDKQTDVFTRLQKNNIKDRSLLSDRVFGLHCDSEGFIWARTLKGISKIDPKTCKVQNYMLPGLQDLNRSLYNVDIIETKNLLWLGSENKGILRIKKNGQLDPFKEWDINLYGAAVLGLYKDSDSVMFAVSDKGLYKILNQNNTYKVEPLIEDNKIFAASTKLIKFQNTSQLWIATLGYGILIADVNQKKIIRKITSDNISDNLLSNSVIDFLQDDEKNFFIATGRGINVYSPYSRLFNIYENSFRKILDFGHPIYAVHELPNSNLLIGTKYRGLYLFNSTTYEAVPIPLPGNNIAANKKAVYGISPFKHNQFLICTARGIFGLTLKENVPSVKSLNEYPELKKIDSIAITNVFVQNDSMTYISSATDGIFKWNYKTHSLKQYKKNDLIPRSGPSDNHVMKIVATKENDLIICTRFGFSIYYPAADTFLNVSPGKNYPYDLPGRNVKYAFDDGEYVWVTTFGAGVQKFDKKKRTFTGITTKEGLPDDAVYAAVPDGDGRVYITTNNGLGVYNIKTRAIQIFTTQDGLPDNEFNGYSAYKSNSGKIFFSTLNGVVSISNNVFAVNPYSPNIVLTSFNAYGAKKDSIFNTYGDTFFRIPQGLNSINLRIASLSYASPSKNIYKVILEGYDEQWINLGQDNEISYRELAPGKYVFKAMATNNSGKWSDKMLTIRINILPYWYQTLGFKLLVLFAFAIILYGIYKYRVRQSVIIAEMRQKISGDLHDDIGSTLSSNKIYTKLAKESPENKKYLEFIEENTNNVIRSLDEMVWSINPKNDSLSALADHMSAYAYPLLAASNINCHYSSNLTDVHSTITPEQRRHLFLSLKEMVNNVIKHANCNNCYINFSKKSNYLYVEVTDDGEGFDPKNVNTTRNGLHSLGFRAKLLKGTFFVESEPKKGSTVRMMLKV